MLIIRALLSMCLSLFVCVCSGQGLCVDSINKTVFSTLLRLLLSQCVEWNPDSMDCGISATLHMVPSPGVRSAISSESGLTVWVWERSKVAAEVPEANQGSDGESEEPVASDAAEADGEAEPVLVDKDVRSQVSLADAR